jgi:hypothetical protein
MGLMIEPPDTSIPTAGNVDPAARFPVRMAIFAPALALIRADEVSRVTAMGRPTRLSVKGQNRKSSPQHSTNYTNPT